MAQQSPKREFRGAWLHVIGPVAYAKMTPERQKDFLIGELDKLESAGCNAVIFQVRPGADALYRSQLEPWSAYLTGKRGKAPATDWDPMEFLIEECHKRGMEFHAWLNPYRVQLSTNEVLPANHASKQHPERFFKYNNQLFFDPAYQENRDFIASVVKDIVKRYDVDAIHMDDYFYPYPAGGTPITGDNASYAKFGNGKNKGDWRRENVNKLIEQLHYTIKKEKPWVRFGISPFGIWRNQKNDPRGSESNGCQNYDDLFADILLWDKNGWVDYLAPQLYWELDLKAAPSRKLIKWWADNVQNAHLYIGQDVKRTMDKGELDEKVRLSRTTPGVGGNIWWHGYWVTDNYKGARTQLSERHQSALALPPAFGNQAKAPKAPSGLKLSHDKTGDILVNWEHGHQSAKKSETDVVKYAVYEIFDGEPVNTDNPETLVAVTPLNGVRLAPGSRRTLLVTAIDRMNRESAPAKITIK